MTPIKAAAGPSREDDLTRLLDEAWPDGHRAAARKILEHFTVSAPAGNAGVKEEADRLADWIIGYLSDECGLIANDMSKADRSAVANAICNSLAPPEASFDNASDMLGYLNAPREAGEQKSGCNNPECSCWFLGEPCASPIPEAPGVREEIIEECAKVAETYHPHKTIAQRIRALKPQDGGKCEHGIAKVNCGVCVPSEVFSKLQDSGESGS